MLQKLYVYSKIITKLQQYVVRKGMTSLKTRVVELSEFERDMIMKFIKQPKETPIPSGLCRAISRRIEGKAFYDRSHIELKQRQSRITVFPEKA